MMRRPHCRLLVASAKRIRFLERRNEPPTVWLFFLSILRLKPDVVKNGSVCGCVGVRVGVGVSVCVCTGWVVGG